MAPLISSYNENVRPMLDAIDKLRDLGLKEEGIELPTIVVVGDQSSGKSSVSGISLPRGKGIVTRVPLILRLQSCSDGQDEITTDYTPVTGKVSKVLPDEAMIEQAISEATVALAGSRKGVMNCPITLQVRRPDLPILTLIDLPGITRVPIEDQPKDIYDQVKAMIMTYITPKESVILNVLAAEVDFSTCESIVMSQEVDPDGDRTLAVVTKVDRAPDGLYEKIQGNSVRIGLGYERRDLMSGLIGGRYDSFQSDEEMHYAARLHEKFIKFEADMRGALPNFLGADYTERCKKALKEVAGISLPNMLDHAAVRQLVQEVVGGIEGLCMLLVTDCFAYATKVQEAAVSDVCGVYPELSSVAQLQGLNSLRETQESASRFIQDMLKKEKKVIFTVNHYYMDTVSKIHASMAEYSRAKAYTPVHTHPPVPSVEDIASSTASLANLISNNDQAARDLQANMFSYAKVMHKRLCDVIPMEIRMCLETALLDDTDSALWREVHGGDILKIAAVKAADQQRRARLEESIKRLKASEATLLGLASDAPRLLPVA
ncbi:unnamed protein product [Closterium sp. Naga37s-1]|nr:unnamed protein product [Closterium sp. Naga37s-1]